MAALKSFIGRFHIFSANVKPAYPCRLLHYTIPTQAAENEPSSQYRQSNDDTDHIQRWELLQRVKGLDDPFQMTSKTVTAGTKAKPTLISTIYDQRIVGCVCKEDSVVIKWTKLHLGETKKCECGHWFKLVPLDEGS
ncbi:cytochrome c oxidase subunit 5B, mitochondrial-like [Watersipora subatra]|uniref:cytochrome c oxidase subunit 5B, mitochondrial-like n=1 Tax=Watersipora subatra TaxID=2589382 RepID=UPI00355BBE36